MDPCCQNVNECFNVFIISFSYFNKATYKKSLSLFCIHGLGWRLLIKCPVAQSKSSIPKRIIEIIYKIQNQFPPNNLDNLEPFRAARAVWAECKQRHVSCVSSRQCSLNHKETIILYALNHSFKPAPMAGTPAARAV